jgi:signal transduction histidine kinase
MCIYPETEHLILNVDDSDGARYAKTRILERAGLTVIEAGNGAEALEKAQKYKPVLILLDVKLPDINGMEVCRRLKADPETRSILVLQTSASYIGSADKVRALDGGADNYLVEPIEPEELIANVNALIRLGRLERELREIDRRRNEFLATLAHELRNPLGPIKYSVEILKHLDPQVPDPQRIARETILRHTDHLTRLVDDLLDVSRIAKGKISLRLDRVGLAAVVNNAVETSRSLIESRQHRLIIRGADTSEFVHGDAVRLTQIIANLLINAAKFTEVGGTIHLAVDTDENNVLVSIADSGIGIAQDNLESIFDIFSQSGRTTDKAYEGLGIGLSIVRTLVQLHGGRVEAFSEGVGRGSCFKVVLPKMIENISAPAERAGDHPVGKRRIVVVDDNRDSANALAQVLEFAGNQVATAFTAVDGFRLVSEFEPEIVFLDIGLPDKNGYEVATDMAQLPHRQHMLLVALTGYGQERDKEAAKNSGFDRHFVKPIEFEKLRELGISV